MLFLRERSAMSLKALNAILPDLLFRKSAFGSNKPRKSLASITPWVSVNAVTAPDISMLSFPIASSALVYAFRAVAYIEDMWTSYMSSCSKPICLRKSGDPFMSNTILERSFILLRTSVVVWRIISRCCSILSLAPGTSAISSSASLLTMSLSMSTSGSESMFIL